MFHLWKRVVKWSTMHYCIYDTGPAFYILARPFVNVIKTNLPVCTLCIYIKRLFVFENKTLMRLSHFQRVATKMRTELDETLGQRCNERHTLASCRPRFVTRSCYIRSGVTRQLELSKQGYLKQ